MLYLYYLLLLIMQINLGNTYHLNIPIIYHLNIPLTIEKEEDGRLPFLDINNFRENNKFATNVLYQLIPTSKVLYLKHVKLV